MIATLLGREAFRAGMDLYFERHDGEACTIEQFVACFEEAGETGLSQFMRWYDQPGTPTVTMTTTAESDGLRVKLRQSQPPAPDGTEPQPLPIPLTIEVIGGEAGAIEGGSGTRVIAPDGAPIVVLEASEGELRLSGNDEAVLALPVQFSAPIMLERDGAEMGIARTIAGNASDPFLRWDAFNSAMLALLADLGSGGASDPAAEIETLTAMLEDDALSPAFRAEIAKLPGDAEIARAIGSDVDPDTVHAARDRVVRAIALGAGNALAQLYDGMAVTGDYQPNAEQSGRRALRNMLLDILSAGEGPERAAKQYRSASNMTERFAALATLAHRFPASTEAEHALTQFADEFAGNALVMDKWLGVQALAPDPSALDRVIALEDHPTYDPLNPNRVRALWGAFSGNRVAFHRADGRGHDTLVRRLATFDATNPQLAARLANAFRDHAQLEPTRRKTARNALEWLANREGISVDLRDIVRRTLG